MPCHEPKAGTVSSVALECATLGDCHPTIFYILLLSGKVVGWDLSGVWDGDGGSEKLLFRIAQSRKGLGIEPLLRYHVRPLLCSHLYREIGLMVKPTFRPRLSHRSSLMEKHGRLSGVQYTARFPDYTSCSRRATALKLSGRTGQTQGTCCLASHEQPVSTLQGTARHRPYLQSVSGR